MEPIRELKELSWKEARKLVSSVNPELAECIDGINPSKDYRLFKATYLYGDQLVVCGESHLPTPSGELAPMRSSEISDYIKEHLSYNFFSNPANILLSKSLELFLPSEERAISLFGIMPVKPGLVSGTWRVLNPKNSNHPSFLWNMTAGARSIFMLPKISDTRSHYKIQKELGIQAEAPKNLLDHWEVFKQIANSPEEMRGKPWKMEILFFSKKWFDHLKDDAWKGFYNYLLDQAFSGSEFWRNQFVWDLVFSLIRKSKNIKPHAYIADIVKNLYAISAGGTPGFAPALDNEQAPVQLIQQVYTDVYKIKEYCPVILQPTLFSMDKKETRPVYYLLNFPTAIEFSPKTNMKVSNVADLCMVRNLLSIYKNEISSSNMKISSTPYYRASLEVEYKLFHSSADQYYEIYDTQNIPIEDAAFTKSLTKNSHNKFPHDSSIMKGGCVRIKLK